MRLRSLAGNGFQNASFGRSAHLYPHSGHSFPVLCIIYSRAMLPPDSLILRRIESSCHTLSSQSNSPETHTGDSKAFTSRARVDSLGSLSRVRQSLTNYWIPSLPGRQKNYEQSRNLGLTEGIKSSCLPLGSTSEILEQYGFYSTVGPHDLQHPQSRLTCVQDICRGVPFLTSWASCP